MGKKSELLKSGQRFNYLTVIKLDHIEQQMNHTDKKIRNIEYYLCQCQCGQFKVLDKHSLKRAKSCGCKIHLLKENHLVEQLDYFELHIFSKRENKNIIILVDKEDVERIKMFKWSLKYDKTVDNYYVIAWERHNYKDRKRVSLHRFIMNCPEGLEVDHINRNTRDNRKSNLRIVTPQENANNKGEYKNNKSGYKHIYYLKNLNTWACTIKRNKKIVFNLRNKDLNTVIKAKQKFLEESEVNYGF
jgi:hypothetical protein